MTDASPLRRDPTLLEEHEPPSGALVQVLEVPADLVWFEGHFPGHPVLPGIVQLRWAIAAAQRLLRRSDEPASIQQVKFKIPILPGARLELQVFPGASGDTAGFAIRSDQGEHSSGRLQFRV